MSFRTPPQRLFRDISDAIEMIEQFTNEMDVEQCRSGPMAVAAVERKIMVISEAGIRLGDVADRCCPGQDWRDIRGIGNKLRHGYEQGNIETIWATVCDDLPKLKAAVVKVLTEGTTDPQSPDSF